MGVGYLLVLHGSHDPRYQTAIDQFKAQLAAHLPRDRRYALAFLECTETPLSQQILDFAQQLQAQGCQELQILPLFLQAGVHVMEDIPAQVTAAQTQLAERAPRMTIVVQPYLGSQLTANLPTNLFPADAQSDWQRLLVAHGTKRSGGNQSIVDLADRLQAQAAYWFVEPHVPDRVTALYAQGVRQIVLLPYVLMEGSLTEGIERQLVDLRAQFADLQIDRCPALLESGQLVSWLAGELAHEAIALTPCSELK
jgi:sirohydrochlorin cobaltochelatase